MEGFVERLLLDNEAAGCLWLQGTFALSISTLAENGGEADMLSRLAMSDQCVWRNLPQEPVCSRAYLG